MLYIVFAVFGVTLLIGSRISVKRGNKPFDSAFNSTMLVGVIFCVLFSFVSLSTSVYALSETPKEIISMQKDVEAKENQVRKMVDVSTENEKVHKFSNTDDFNLFMTIANQDPAIKDSQNIQNLTDKIEEEKILIKMKQKDLKDTKDVLYWLYAIKS